MFCRKVFASFASLSEVCSCKSLSRIGIWQCQIDMLVYFWGKTKQSLLSSLFAAQWPCHKADPKVHQSSTELTFKGWLWKGGLFNIDHYVELNQPLSSLRHWSPKGDSAQRLEGKQRRLMVTLPHLVMYLMMWKIYWYLRPPCCWQNHLIYCLREPTLCSDSRSVWGLMTPSVLLVTVLVLCHITFVTKSARPK